MKWVSAIESLETRTYGALDEIEDLLQLKLPATLTLTGIGQDYPAAFAACVRSFPVLVAERADRPLEVLERLHFITSEKSAASNQAVMVLDSLLRQTTRAIGSARVDEAMRLLGALWIIHTRVCATSIE